MPLSYIFRGGAFCFFDFFWGPLASCIVLGCFLGFAFLVIKELMQKKKKKKIIMRFLVVYNIVLILFLALHCLIKRPIE